MFSTNLICTFFNISKINNFGLCFFLRSILLVSMQNIYPLYYNFVFDFLLYWTVETMPISAASPKLNNMHLSVRDQQFGTSNTPSTWSQPNVFLCLLVKGVWVDFNSTHSYSGQFHCGYPGGVVWLYFTNVMATWLFIRTWLCLLFSTQKFSIENIRYWIF